MKMKQWINFDGAFVQRIGQIVFSLFVCFLIPTVGFGQMTARSLGMANAYTALARGVHAPLWNPANLGLPDNPNFSFSLISLAAGVENNTFSKSFYDKYFTGGDENNEVYWTPEDVLEILGLIPEDGVTLNIGATVRTFSFSAGKFALSMGASAQSYVQIDKTVLELPLQGNEMNQTYDFSDPDGKGIIIGGLNLSYGNLIPCGFADRFALGGTVHFFYGGFCSNIDYARFVLKTADDGFEINGNYELNYTYLSDKIGWGADIGAAAQFDQGWTVSCAVGNILGSIPWTRHVNQEYGIFEGDSITIENADDALLDSTWSVEAASFSEKLPTVLRLGCAYQEGPVLLTADYIQGFKKGVWATTKPQFSFGTEWEGIKWLPLRAGVTLGGEIGLGTSFGFGLHPGGLVLDFGMLSRGFLLPTTSKGYVFGFEMGYGLD
jgi:hypothetical protein